jgi:hypothetical protein
MKDPIIPFDAPFSQQRDAALAEASRMAGAKGRLNMAQVQRLYDHALKNAQSLDLDAQALAIGYAFGELIAERSKYEWKLAFDEYGNEPVIAEPSGTYFCAPILMIGRRLVQGQAANLDRLCNETIQTIRDSLKKGGGAR